MGNALRFVCCGKPSADSQSRSLHGVSATTGGVSALGVSALTGGVSALGVSALAHDLSNFEMTSQVPKGLRRHVVASKKAQAKWYKKLLAAWRKAKPPPKTHEEASRLVIQTLKRHRKANVQGLLAFYGLLETEVSYSLPEGIKFELQTLPVKARAVGDGDGMTVYVSTADPSESSSVPSDVQIPATERSEARAEGNKAILQDQIVEAEYKVNNFQNEEILAQKYRIRLRGIDAPELGMPYGKEAKEELTKIIEGKCLRILVYGKDQFDRLVGDVYCNDIFVQEVMLKKGLAWHFVKYDKRPELAEWENAARAKQIGLWADPNPQKPWEWRKERR